MADKNGKTMAELAALCGGRLLAAGDYVVAGVAPLEDAGPDELAPLMPGRSKTEASKSRAGAFLLKEPLAGESRPMIVHPEPAFALAVILDAFHPVKRPEPGVRETAYVAPSAVLGPGVAVLEGAIVGPDAVVGARTVIGYGSVVEDGARIGDDCELGTRSVVCKGCVLGHRVVLQPGAVVGSMGFGLARDGKRWRTIPQVGNVILGDGVEVGANTCIDRATMASTRVDKGTKIDNLVQVGHNVVIGSHVAVAAQAGIAGSCVVEDHAQLGGQSGLSGHIRIGKGAKVAAKSGVHANVPAGQVVAGYPAMKISKWRRVVAAFEKLDEIRKTVSKLGKVGGHGR